MNKIDYNKKMLGKFVLVKRARRVDDDWIGQIIGVLDAENFTVVNNESKETFKVNIYDIRSVKNEKK